MSSGGDKDKQKNFPFFWGIYYGAWNKYPSWYVGGLRTGVQLGLAGKEAQDLANLHNHLTVRAGKAGLQALWTGQFDPTLIPLIWNQLPPDAKANATDYGKDVAGQIVGGGIVNFLTGKGLVKYLKLPKVVVAPTLLWLTCQGAMGAFWKDSWKKDPPDGPGGGGGIGGGKLLEIK